MICKKIQHHRMSICLFVALFVSFFISLFGQSSDSYALKSEEFIFNTFIGSSTAISTSGYTAVCYDFSFFDNYDWSQLVNSSNLSNYRNFTFGLVSLNTGVSGNQYVSFFRILYTTGVFCTPFSSYYPSTVSGSVSYNNLFPSDFPSGWYIKFWLVDDDELDSSDCPDCDDCPDVPPDSGDDGSGNYDQKLDDITKAIYTCGAILIMLYFFFCIYQIIIKPNKGAK